MSLQDALTSSPTSLYPKASNGKIEIEALSEHTFLLYNPDADIPFALVGAGELMDYLAYRSFDINAGWSKLV